MDEILIVDLKWYSKNHVAQSDRNSEAIDSTDFFEGLHDDAAMVTL